MPRVHCILSKTQSQTHTHTHICALTHTSTQTVHCRAMGSVMGSPEHVCVVANALRQGTWLTTAPGEARNQRRADPAKRSQHQTSFRKGDSTQHAVILPLPVSITMTFFKKKKTSSCFNSSCLSGAELSSSVMVSGVWLKVLHNQT